MQYIIHRRPNVLLPTFFYLLQVMCSGKTTAQGYPHKQLYQKCDRRIAPFILPQQHLRSLLSFSQYQHRSGY